MCEFLQLCEQELHLNQLCFSTYPEQLKPAELLVNMLQADEESRAKCSAFHLLR